MIITGLTKIKRPAFFDLQALISFIRHIGYFPKAAIHYRERRKGRWAFSFQMAFIFSRAFPGHLFESPVKSSFGMNPDSNAIPNRVSRS
jgi:hypothetical protein